jgi:RNA polymerase sigma-70 factor (ECF subfamily)
VTTRLENLLLAAKAGDQLAFAEVYRSLQPALLRYLRVTAGTDAADDLASEAWYEVARGLARFEGDEAGFRGWVFTIARHRFLDWRRSVARRPADPVPAWSLEFIAGGDDPEAAVTAAAATEDALRLIAQLPPDQAEVVALRAIAGLDVAQVAELLGKRAGAVRVCGHRGLKKLAELLGARDGAEKTATGV